MGQKRGHKGGRRQFTNPQLLDKQREKEEKEREWRRKRGEVEESDEEEDEDEEDEESQSEDEEQSDDSDEEEEDEEDEESEKEAENTNKSGAKNTKFEVCNPNRMPQKVVNKRKVNELIKGKPKVELSRREREEIEKQQKQAAYNRLHAQGKTEEARADLARLALIRQKREEAAKKRDSEQKAASTSGAVASTSKSKH